MKVSLALSALFLLLNLSCAPKAVRDEKKPEPADTAATLNQQEDVSYQAIYGMYQHESNSAGFFAEIEINPMGNDLQFALTLKQPGCDWELQGTLAMMYHLKNEHAGFYNSETCRLVFTFFPASNQLRLDEAGICVALPAGCSLGGIYRKASELK